MAEVKIPPLVPFLLEERESYARNLANRTAEVLNLEVLPMLDRVIIQNRFVTAPALKSKFRILDWNAERGTYWHVLPTFMGAEEEDVNFLILNELDWGMARSGNIHTAELLAERLKMNFAYGVEFMELTNGNQEEIRATPSMTNTVGYHGNVVMSKWPILDAKIVRLHPLYDYLYKSKAGWMDQGERRLGGRMALFSTLRVGDVDLLVISMHSQVGSDKTRLQEDANIICKNIDDSIANVIIGGDIAKGTVDRLISKCGFFSLETTNQKVRGYFKSTWKVTCPSGNAPIANQGRGDWMLARGSGLQVDTASLTTVHPFIKPVGQKYECISDHSVIGFDFHFK